MLVSIQHNTELRYTDRISETVMELRMTPLSDAHQTLRGRSIAVGPSATLFEHIDWLGNHVHQFSISGFHDRVLIVAESAVDVHPARPELGSLNDALPLALDDHRVADYLRFGGPVTRDERLEHLAGYLGIDQCQRSSDVVARVTEALADRVGYKKGITSSATTVSDVLTHGEGVCQDFAHLGIALCRLVGVPCRYVSGYLHRSHDEAELETHAWCEAYFPSFGWFAFDPTHRQLANEQHIAVAVGRSYADVPPNRGVYRGSAKESIDVKVSIQHVSEVPRGLRAPRAAHLDVPTLEGTPEHREQIDYQQEQQQQQ